jgi:hypothetical protein
MHFDCKPHTQFGNTSNSERKKCAYVFGDGVAWEIVDKNIVQSWNAKKDRQIFMKQMFVCLLN